MRRNLRIWPHSFAAILAAAMSVAFGASTATAASTSVQLELYGSVQPTCAFTQTPTQQDLTALQQGAVLTLGTLAFRCNLADSPNVHLTGQSDNGALKRDGGAETVAYS